MYNANIILSSSLERGGLRYDMDVLDLTDILNEDGQKYINQIPAGMSLTIMDVNDQVFDVKTTEFTFSHCGSIFYNGDCEAREGLSGTFLFQGIEEYIKLKRYFLINQELHDGKDLKSAIKASMIKGLTLLGESEYWDHKNINSLLQMDNKVVDYRLYSMQT